LKLESNLEETPAKDNTTTVDNNNGDDGTEESSLEESWKMLKNSVGELEKKKSREGSRRRRQ